MPYKNPAKRRECQRISKQRPEYHNRELARLSSRHAKEWSLGDAVIATVDGEDAHDDGNYSELGIETPTGQRAITSAPGTSLTFLQFAHHLRKTKSDLKRQYGRRIYFISYYFGYDIHSVLLHDQNITPAQKWAIRERQSKRYGAVRTADYNDVVLLPQYQLGVKIQPKSVEIYFYKSDNAGGILYKDEQPVIYNRVKIDDIGTTFAMRFDLALKLFRSEVPEEQLDQFDTELAIISRGKDARGDFKGAGMTVDDVKKYNQLEGKYCNWLGNLMIRLAKSLGLRPRSLAGPAPWARSLFDMYALREHIKPEYYDDVAYQEGEAMNWHRDSFHAGHIEQSFIGYVPSWWEIDTRNAYVAAERDCPCAAHAVERPLTAEELTDVNVHRVVHDGWEYEIIYRCKPTRPFGPFAHRWRAGTKFPLRGRERVYGVELRAFFDTLGDDTYDVVAGLAHESTCDKALPFAEMTTTTYASRAQHKRTGHMGLAEIEKKALVSGYGVTAQAAGGYRTVDKDTGETLAYHTPRYSNLWMAGYITAYERARQMRYNRTYGRDVFGHATDAVFMHSLPPDVAALESEELGGVEVEQNGPTVFLGAGIRSAQINPKKKSKRRGFTVDIPFEQALAAYRNGEGTITISYRHFKGLPESVHNRNGVITIDADAGTFQVQDKVLAVSLKALESKRDITGKIEHVTLPDGTDYVYAPPPLKPTGIPLRYHRPFDKPVTNILQIAVQLAERNMEKYQP